MTSRVLSLPLLLFVLATAAGCILRPGMNAECRWPPEDTSALNLSDPADQRHLVVDAELVDELADRYRFNPDGSQQRCREKLITEVAQVHSVSVAEVSHARERVADRGLNLPVAAPMTVAFLLGVWYVLRRIDARFGDEEIARFVSLGIASVALSGVFVFVGEFWTSVLQMIRVGS